MVKRRKAKESTTAKTKASSKEKTAKPLNTEETSSEIANHISNSQESLDSIPSSIKKPKLDSSQSPNAKTSKKFVPPFTTSQRASMRLIRKRMINSKKSDIGSQEAESVEGEKNDVAESAQEEVQSLESKEETSAMVLELNKDERDNVPPRTSFDTKLSDVENAGEKDPKAEKGESEDESICLSSEKQSGVDSKISINHGTDKDENTVTHAEIGKKVIKKVIQGHQSREEMGMFKKGVGGNVGSSNESEKSKLEEDTIIANEGMSNVASLQAHMLDTNLNSVEARLCDFDASLHTLADTCAEEDYILDVVTVSTETDRSESSLSHLQDVAEIEIKGLSRKRKTVEKKNNLQDSDKPNVAQEHDQHVKADVPICSSSKPNTTCTTLAETRGTRGANNLVNPESQPANKIGGKNSANFTIQAILNEPMNKSSSHEPQLQDTARSLSQQLIVDKISEMLSIVSGDEVNGPSLSQNKNERKTNVSSLTEYNNNNLLRQEDQSCNDKSLDDPVNERSTRLSHISSEGDKSGSSQDKQHIMKESDSSKMDIGDDNAQNATTTEKIEVMTVLSVDVNNQPVRNETVEDGMINQFSTGVNRDKNSQNATTAEQIEVMSVDVNNQPVRNETVEGGMNNQFSDCVNGDKNSQNVTATLEKVEDPSKHVLSSRVPKTSEVEDAVGEIKEFASNKQAFNENSSDQEIPVEELSSPEQTVPDTIATSPTTHKDILKNKITAESCTNAEVATAALNASEHPTTVVTQNDSKEVCSTKEEEDITTSSDIADDQSFAKAELEALEELLPREDVGFFDDLGLMSQPKSINLNVNELADGDSTVEFLINELNSLHCMVANHKRAVEDMKRQYKFGRS